MVAEEGGCVGFSLGMLVGFGREGGTYGGGVPEADGFVVGAGG